MMCENFLHEGASLFIGATSEDERDRPVAGPPGLCGFCYGFVGIRDKPRGFAAPDNLWFYSQYTAVRPGYEGNGLGVVLKEFQRDVIRDVFGISRIVCTYDPLTAVNAHRNVRRFGMDVLEYRPATYGAYGGRLNREDVPTDRFFMSWDLRAEEPRRAAGSRTAHASAAKVIDAGERTVEGRSGPVRMETARGLNPEVAGGSAFVRIPRDFYRMLRETDVADPEVRRIPVDWRMETRRAFVELFARGYRVADFLTGAGPEDESGYLLERRLP
jgi:predicted GNAT superfamily acetyltransferase